MQEQQLAEAEVQEAPVQTAETEQPQEQNNAPQDSPEDISEATGMGWVPKEKFRGDPNMWKPAGEFVRRGREILPIIQKRERAQQDEIRSLRSQLENQNKSHSESYRRLEGMTRVALEQQRSQIENAYEAAKRKAVHDGDTETYDRLNEEGKRAVANFDPAAAAERYAAQHKPQEQQQQQVPANIQSAVQNWVADNRWFDSDEEMREIATFEHGRLLKRMPGLSIEENLQKTLEYVKERFPNKFGSAPKPQGQQPHSPAVEGGGRQPQNSNGRARGWNDLPPEAKSSGERFITRDGLFLPKGADAENPTDKDIQAARAAFAKNYWEQEV